MESTGENAFISDLSRFIYRNAHVIVEQAHDLQLVRQRENLLKGYYVYCVKKKDDLL